MKDPIPFVKLYSQDTSWWSLSWRIYCPSDDAKLPRCCCQGWKEFQQIEANQTVSYDR